MSAGNQILHCIPRACTCQHIRISPGFEGPACRCSRPSDCHSHSDSVVADEPPESHSFEYRTLSESRVLVSPIEGSFGDQNFSLVAACPRLMFMAKSECISDSGLSEGLKQQSINAMSVGDDIAFEGDETENCNKGQNQRWAKVTKSSDGKYYVRKKIVRKYLITVI
jgi:hypothetical protein